jgi:hypothetical protein
MTPKKREECRLAGPKPTWAPMANPRLLPVKTTAIALPTLGADTIRAARAAPNSDASPTRTLLMTKDEHHQKDVPEHAREQHGGRNDRHHDDGGVPGCQVAGHRFRRAIDSRFEGPTMSRIGSFQGGDV